ncbi:NAD(P)/FAD-dependent oxidoreductase [Eubacteriales bacterium OttesenSCG-928-A19]|nr:NAD(P)/FAD-dependent oxidoreductase [Eubacteriales bacterium OttesenSCG-928-A19]
MKRYDAAIIGGGPAGLEAAINLQIRKKSFLLFASEPSSRKLLAAPRVDNYLGLYGVSGKELSERFMEHARAMNIEALTEQVQMILHMGDAFSLAAGDKTYEATTVILAPGIAHAKPIPGEETFLGQGVGYCATCDAPLYRGKSVAILGFTEEAVHEARYVAEIAEKVYYIPMAKTPDLPPAPVEIQEGEVLGIEGDSAVRALRFSDRILAVDGVFILREFVAPTSLMPGIEMNESYIRVNHDMETNLPGCYAAGDCTGKPHQFMRAAGQGQTAALNAVAYLDRLRKAEK